LECVVHLDPLRLQQPRLAIAVNPSLLESDFLPVGTDQIAEALGGGDENRLVSVTVGSGSDDDPFELRGYASYLLVALAFMFVGESLLASRG